jgi:hypothetical protein
MKCTAWGTVAMSGSFLLGTIIAAGSLISMRGRLDTATLTSQPLSIPTVLVSCLDPLAILLEVAAIVLIVLDSKQVGNPHRRLARTALVFFILWAVVNLGVFVPLSLVSMREGSLPLFRVGQMAKAGAALLQYAIPFLLIYGLSDRTPRILLWLGLVLTISGNFATVVLPIKGMEFEVVEAAGQAIHVPRFSVDYTTGVYPILLSIGYIGGALYMIAYALLAVGFLRMRPSGGE